MLGEVLPTGVREIMSDITQSLTEYNGTPGAIDALKRADLDSDLAEWLASVGVPGELSSGLVDAGITADRIRPLASLVSRKVLTLGLRILAADYEIVFLTCELEAGARRIYHS